MIPAEAIRAATQAFIEHGTLIPALEAAAPHMLAAILDDAADTAETDELTTAAEVIYDLRRHAKDLRPTP